MTTFTTAKHLFLVLFLVALSACDVDEPCDPGQIKVQGACMDAPPMDAGRDTGDDAAPADDDAGETVCLLNANEGLGDVCTTDGDCQCSTPFCARQPGAATGTCTITGCGSNGVECPTGYMCFDLSAIGVADAPPPFCISQN